jgi:hypothetical protein
VAAHRRVTTILLDRQHEIDPAIVGRLTATRELVGHRVRLALDSLQKWLRSECSYHVRYVVAVLCIHAVLGQVACDVFGSLLFLRFLDSFGACISRWHRRLVLARVHKRCRLPFQREARISYLILAM